MPTNGGSATTDRPALLAVCTLPPFPADNGYSLRVSHLLQHLAPNWSITLIAPSSNAPMPPNIATHVPVTLPTTGVTYPWRFDQAPLRAAIDRTIRDHRPTRALIWPGAETQWFNRPDLPPAVVDIIDCNPLEFWRGVLHYRGLRQRWRALCELPIATSTTRRMVRSYAATTCVGEADASWLRRIGQRDTVHVIPNGVDIPPPDSLPPEAPTPTLSFTGSLDYQPNIEAVRHAVTTIWPRIRTAEPHARFIIAGRNPIREIQDLATQPGIELVAKPPDMAPIIAQSWLSIAPMRSGVGIKNKVLEAWACARPVVLSKLATNGLILPPDHASLVHTDPAAMAAAVIRLFRDPKERHRLGQSARDTVQQHFIWAGAASRLDALLRNAAQ